MGGDRRWKKYKKKNNIKSKRLGSLRNNRRMNYGRKDSTQKKIEYPRGRVHQLLRPRRQELVMHRRWLLQWWRLQCHQQRGPGRRKRTKRKTQHPQISLRFLPQKNLTHQLNRKKWKRVELNMNTKLKTKKSRKKKKSRTLGARLTKKSPEMMLCRQTKVPVKNLSPSPNQPHRP